METPFLAAEFRDGTDWEILDITMPLHYLGSRFTHSTSL
jgi:hypothetical protein